MSSNYPTSKDDATSLPNPTATSKTNSPSHSALHSDENEAIIAVQNKLGTGASTPASNTLLTGTGSGTSAWSTLTSSALRGILTDETGTGSAVFADSPTLITPAVDTINESTSDNGVTIDGLNIKDGKLNTNNSVATTTITDSAITTAKIADSAVTAAKQGDSGWTNFTLQNSWAAASGETPGYRKIGNVVYLRGAVVKTTASSEVCATLPVGFRPPVPVRFPITSNTSAIFNSFIDTDGTITMGSTSSSSAYRGLSGGIFTLD